MKKETKEDSFIRQPYYDGGDKAMIVFIVKNLRYPTVSLANKVEGGVHIKYDINNKGHVTDAKIVSGLDPACNEEAVRVVKLLKFIVPKNPRKMRIIFHKKIRIHFSPTPITLPVTDIENIEDVQQSHTLNPVIQYNFVASTPVQHYIAKDPKPAVQKISYNYTIKM
jgi:TonB family protein